MTQDQIMALVDDFSDAVGDYVASDYVLASDNTDLNTRAIRARAAVVAAIEALTKDAARWKMLAEMEASMVAGETMRFYIANPDKLDYVIELKNNAYDAAIAAQKEQV